jgi:hypothetical protein
VSETHPLECELPLLGTRTYLHGTTLFDALMKHVPEAATVSFTISQRIDSDRVAFIFHPAEYQQGDGVHAKLAWRRDATSGLIAVKPLPSSMSPRRAPYDESLVTRALVRGDQSVTLDKATTFSFVTTLIPMFKVLLGNCVDTTKAGQWMFTRLDATPPTDELFLPLCLKFKGMIGNSLARSTIECRGGSIGSLYFSWVPATRALMPHKADG